MNCNRCGSPLPNRGALCSFCGAMMDKSQIEFQVKNKQKERLELKSDMYGINKNIEYRENGNNTKKIIGVFIIGIILIILLVVGLLLFF